LNKVVVIKEDTSEKDKDEDKKYKRLSFLLKVPLPPGVSAAGQPKRTQELSFTLFLNQPDCSKILVYESGLL
jgi:hypothetical protein